jgi:hypothetical protein
LGLYRNIHEQKCRSAHKQQPQPLPDVNRRDAVHCLRSAPHMYPCDSRHHSLIHISILSIREECTRHTAPCVKQRCAQYRCVQHRYVRHRCRSTGFLDWARLYASFASAGTDAIPVDFWTGPDYLHHLQHVCWCISTLNVLTGPDSTHRLHHVYWCISTLNVWTGPDSTHRLHHVCWCISIGSLDWAYYMHWLHLQVLTQFQWISRLDIQDAQWMLPKQCSNHGC